MKTSNNFNQGKFKLRSKKKKKLSEEGKFEVCNISCKSKEVTVRILVIAKNNICIYV